MSFRRRSDKEPLNLRTIDNTINSLKENCTGCRDNIEHECCIKSILHEWEDLRKEYVGKYTRS